MKKLIPIIILAALATPVFAQGSTSEETKWTVRASAGYYPTLPTLTTILGAFFVAPWIGLDEDNNEEWAVEIPPYLSVEAMYSFNHRWSLGFGTGYTGTVWEIVDKDTREVHSSTFLTFIPLNVIGRCNYISRPAFRMYGSLEAGAMLFAGSGLGASFSFQINPLGMEFGRRFFGFAEAGAGMNYFGCRLGAGYRF